MEIFEESFTHVIAMFMSFVVFFYVYKSDKGFGGKIGEGFKLVFFGVLFLALIHTSEIVGPDLLKIYDISDHTQDTLEHILFWIAMFFFIVGFRRISKALEEK